MVRIYLVRHAHSLAQERGEFDTKESGLSAIGKNQAQSFSKFIENLPNFKEIDFYSSNYKRAKETASLALEGLGLKYKELEIIHELDYPKVLQRKKRADAEVQKIYEEYKKAWLSGKKFQDAETFTEFKSRVGGFLSFVLSLKNDSVLFTHGLFIKMFITRVLFGKDFSASDFLKIYENVIVDNVSVWTFEIAEGKIYLLNPSVVKNIKTMGTKRKKQVVTIGGGTGQYTLLKGLKDKDFDIKAIVSMADDGGTTGVLRDELGVLPPTDLRKCIIALSDAEKELRDLFAFRFYNKNLKGHTLGNLFISAAEKVFKDFDKALESIKRLFNLKGDVLPVSYGNMQLVLQLKDGRKLYGESVLDSNKDLRKVGLEKISLKKQVALNKKARQAILDADYIIVGPGDLYGSILPNFLVRGMKSAIQKSKAKKIFVCNLTNKKGQTEGFDVLDYLEKIKEYAGVEFGYVLANSEPIPQELETKYKRKEGKGAIVKCFKAKLKEKFPSTELVFAPLLSNERIKKERGDNLSTQRSFIRHDSKKLANAIEKIIYSEKATKKI